MHYINSNNDKGEVLPRHRLYIARLFFVIFLKYAIYLFLVNKSDLIKFRMPEVHQYR